MAPTFKPPPPRGPRVRGRLPWSVTRGLTNRWPLDDASSAAANSGIIQDIVGGNYATQFSSNAARSIDGPAPGSRALQFSPTGTAGPAAVSGAVFPNASETNVSCSYWLWLDQYDASDGAGLAPRHVNFVQAGKAPLTVLTQGVGTGSGSIQFIDGTGVEVSSLAGVSLNQWAHIAATSDGTTRKIFLNGVSITTYSTTNGTGGDTDSIGGRLSSGSNQRGTVGRIADVRIYRGTTLTDAEINELYLSAFTEEAPDLSFPDWEQLPPATTSALGRLPNRRRISPRLEQPLPDLRNGLQFWVPFHDPSGVTTPKASELIRGTVLTHSRSNPGPILDPALYPDGTIGGGYSFNPADATQISTGGLTTADVLTTSAWSLSIWVKATGSAPSSSANIYNGHHLIGDGGTQFLGLYRANTGSNDIFAIYNWDGSQKFVATPTTPNVWVHLVGTLGNGTLSLYKDGAFVGSVASGATGTLGLAVIIGHIVFAGSVSDARIYNRALDAGEVLALYTDPFRAQSQADESWAGPVSPASVPQSNLVGRLNIGAPKDVPRSRIQRGLTHWWPLDSTSTDFSATAMQTRPRVGNIYGSGQTLGRAREMPFATPPGTTILSNYSNSTSEYCTLNADPFNGGGKPTNYSVAFWVYMTADFAHDAGDPRLVCFDQNDCCVSWRSAIRTFSLWSGPGVTIDTYAAGGFTSVLNTWYHVVVTVAGATPKWYINGVEYAAGGTGQGNQGTTGVWGLMCRSATERVSQGSMYDCMLFVGTTLDAGEVAALYQSYFNDDGGERWAGPTPPLSLPAPPTSTATLAGTGGLTATLSQRIVATATFAGVGSFAANGTIGAQTYQGTALFAGVGSFAATATLRMQATATFAGVGGLTATATTSLLASSTFAGVGSFAATATMRLLATALFAGVGSLTATLTTVGTQPGNATFFGTGGLTATATQRMQVTALLAGVGSFTATALQSLQATALFAGVGSLTANGIRTISATVAFAGVGGLTAQAARLLSATATFAGVGGFSANLTAIGPQIYQISALLAGAGNFIVQLPGQSISASALLRGTGGLAANAIVQLVSIYYDDTEVLCVPYEYRAMEVLDEDTMMFAETRVRAC
jgi:Concanavalin A-like lectin/glucanases superfamily